MKNKRFFLLMVLGSFVSPAWGGEYNSIVRPILSDKCFLCHGPDRNHREGDLRLDDRAAAIGQGALIPGNAAASPVIVRMRSSDPDERMPPPQSHLTLLPAEIDAVARWIDAGAAYEPHWAFVSPVRPELPAARREAHPVDAFVRARLKQEGLPPSGPADKRTLVRRVALDLTGLPPSEEEVARFVADTGPKAYERLVDRLLASRHYGEHMAWFWLDAARYADSNGYQQDRTRTMWPWRDWVVEAFNANMPWNQFTVEQLAGDLLESPTTDQLIASGFNRNHMLNGEGGAIAEESRVNYVMDRVETTGTVWLGLTMTCARCHDHKYDPLLQDEYYSLYAYFNQVDEKGGVDAGGNAQPVAGITTPAQQQRLQAADRQIAAVRKGLKAQPFTSWVEQAQKNADLAPWHLVRPERWHSREGQDMRVGMDGSILVTAPQVPAKEVLTVTFRPHADKVSALLLEAIPYPSFTKGGYAQSDSGNFVLTNLEILTNGVPVKIAAAKATFEQKGHPVSQAIDTTADKGWAVLRPKGDYKGEKAWFHLASPVLQADQVVWTVRLSFNSPHPQHILSHFRLATSETQPTAFAPLVELPVGDVSAVGEKRRLREAWIHERTTGASAKLEELLAQRKKLAADRLQVMVMRERSTPRVTHILNAGQYDDPAGVVGVGVPAPLHPLPDGAATNRLGLARWLVAPENPLTARVTVNRFWQQVFGIGLVKTSEDFGLQGEAPSHPELMDWLAVEFVESGWDVKALMRLLVTSETYKQRAVVSAEQLARDPDNRLLGSYPRRRLPSHVLRDQALHVAGLLSKAHGGPGVLPYQPPGLWEEFSFDKIKYVQDHGEKLYRRSLYLFWRRTNAPTTLFDTPSRQVCEVKPRLTNSPLHALGLLNDPAYVEAARVLAQRALQAKPGDADRLTQIYQWAVLRDPRPEEAAVLLPRLDALRAAYKAKPEEAEALTSVGEFPVDEGLAVAEVAAWTGVTQIVLNLDEVLNHE